MQTRIEIWHPHRSARRPGVVDLDLPVDSDGLGVPSLDAVRAAVQQIQGFEPWVLGFWGRDPVTCRVVGSEHGAWEEARRPASRAPWAHPAWRTASAAWLTGHLGPHRVRQHRVWSRSVVLEVHADGQPYWFKQSYGLPPGEGAGLAHAQQVATPLRVPDLVAVEGTRALMRPLAGTPLLRLDTQEWARAITDVVAFQRAATPWPGIRVTDWPTRLQRLMADYGMPDGFSAEVVERFQDPALLPSTVLPQDLGPCNLHRHDGHTVAYDWTDVCFSDPGMLLDRFLNECETPAHTQAVTQAWLAAWGPGADAAWAATRRLALLHEAVRFDDELPWLDDDAPLALNLRALVRSQLGRMLQHIRG